MSSSAALPSPATSTKIASRQNRTRERILAESTRLLLTRGFDNVSVDAIVSAAEVARSSFYRFFANREEVLGSIMRPVFETGIGMMAEVGQRPPQALMDGICDVYLRLWSASPDTLRLVTRTGGAYFRLFEDLHRRFREQLVDAMQRVETAGLLLNDNGYNSARIIARVAVPLLEVYRDDPRIDILFHQAMNGLLIKPGAKP